MKLVSYLCLLLALNACVKITDKNASDEAQTPTRTPGSVEASHIDGFSTVEESLEAWSQVKALNEPFKYQVLLKMDSEAQVVQRSDSNSDAEPVLLPMHVEAGVFVDKQPESDRDYVYEQGIVRNGSFEVLQTHQVRVPKDGLIDSEISFSENQNWKFDGRLFFTAKGMISTLGYDFILEVRQLISDQGRIRTFPTGSKAPTGVAGRSGGAIRISAGTGRGQLKVEMRGQNGGNGVQGPNYLGVHDGIQKPASDRVSNGLPGKIGGDGMPGGNSGTFQIHLTETHQLLVLHSSECGLGGAGGPGGAGSPPMSSLNMEEGLPGPVGNAGTPGICERSYIQDLTGQRLL